MSTRISGLALVCALSLVGCSGGGGGGAPAPAPTPSPAPVDTTPPDTTLNSSTPAVTNQTTATFSAVSSESGSTFEASLNGNAYQVVAASFSVNALTDGTQNLSVRARDAAGNTDASPAAFSWTVDTEAPDTSISGGPPATTSSQTASFTVASPDTAASFEASLDGAAYAAATSPLSLSGLAAGAHTLSVRARDAAGNVDASPALHSWSVTPPGPSARIIFPGPLGNTESGGITIRGTADGAGSPVTAVNLEVMGAFSIPASTSDGFQNWTASIPVLAASDIVVTVSVTVAGGAISHNVAQTTISNSGHIVADLRGVLFNAATNRVLALDGGRGALLEMRTFDGYAEVLADANHGTGTGTQVGGVCPVLDAPNNRVLTNGGDSILAVNLANGNRSEMVSAQGNQNLSIYGSFAYDSNANMIYGLEHVSSSIIRINVGNGARSVLNGQGFGSGLGLIRPNIVRLDTSGVTANPRLLVAHDGGIAEIDLGTGHAATLPGSAAFPSIIDFVVDAANDRLLVLVPMSPRAFQIGAINLLNGATGMYSASHFEASTSALSAFIALDGTGANAYLGTMDRSRIVRYNFPASSIVPFYDTLVGSGPPMVSTSNLDIDESGVSPMLYSGTRYPKPGIVKLDLGTGVRSAVSMEGVVGSGLGLATPASLGLLKQPGTPPTQMMIIDSGFVPEQLTPINLLDGTRGTSMDLSLSVTYYNNRSWIFDAPRGRFLRGVREIGGVPLLGSVSVPGGLFSVISSPTAGTGPAFDDVAAVGVESLSGGGYRYILADNDGTAQILAVDPATGNRALVSSNGGTGTGPLLPFIHDLDVDTANHRALVVSNGIVQFVDLTNGNRSNLDGFGPAVVGDFMRTKARFADGIAYVKGLYSGDGIFAVDLVTGERALISR